MKMLLELEGYGISQTGSREYTVGHVGIEGPLRKNGKPNPHVGNKYLTSPTYHSGLVAACHRLREHVVYKASCDTLEAHLVEIRHVNGLIREAVGV